MIPSFDALANAGPHTPWSYLSRKSKSILFFCSVFIRAGLAFGLLISGYTSKVFSSYYSWFLIILVKSFDKDWYLSTCIIT